MSFGAPAFAWAFLALLPLVAVFLIRTRPRRQPVNAFFLWRRVLQQKPASSLFQKLRHWLSLAILALAFAAAVLALMKPETGEAGREDLLIVIDRSVSMRGGAGRSRFEEARALVDGWLTALDGNRRAALATADRELAYRVPFTDKAKPLREALAGLEAGELALDPRVLEPLGLVRTEGEEEGGARPVRVLWVTDGRSAAGELPAGVEEVRVGEGGAGNAGIVAADLRWSGRDRARLFVTVASTFETDREVELELSKPDGTQVVRLFTMKLVAGGEASESLEIDRIGPGSWELRMAVADDLAEDNRVPLGLNAPQAIPVQVLSANRFFFDQVVTAFGRAGSMFEPVEDFAQLALAEGVVPDAETAVIFAPQGESPWWSDVGGELPAGVPEVRVEDHPLIARLDPAVMEFAGARALRVPAGAVVVLAHADGTPLLYSAAVEGRRAVVANFDPGRDEFFLSPWFPVLIHDAVAVLTGRKDDFPSVVATGSVVEVPGTGEVERIEKDGEEIGGAEELAVGGIGNYGVRRSSTDWWLGGAVLAAGESGGAGGVGAVPEVAPASGWPPAVWLLVMGVVAVGLEEVLYHRRRVG